MPRLRTFSGKELCKLLADHGFVEVRQKGSHIVMQKRSGSGTTTAIVPAHREIKTGTLLSVIRQSQLPKALFETP